MGSANCCIALHPLRPMSQSAQAEALFRGAQHDTKPEGLQVSLRSHTPTCLRLSSTSRPSMSRRGGARLSRSSSSSVPGPIMAAPLLPSPIRQVKGCRSVPSPSAFRCLSRPPCAGTAFQDWSLDGPQQSIISQTQGPHMDQVSIKP